MKPISKLRFNSLAGYVRDSVLLVTVEELEWYARATVIAVTITLFVFRFSIDTNSFMQG